MAKPARRVVRLVLGAREARAVRTAPGSSDAMATHAELLARAPVTSGARDWIDPRLHPVLAAASPGTGPAYRVWTSRRPFRRDVRGRMAFDARALAVARRADAWIRARLEGVSRAKARAM